MSVQCGTTCITCGAISPSVGDGGFLGAPVLAVQKRCETTFGDIPSFGYFYEPLSGIGVQPYDLESFREFLEAHDGHKLYMTSDHDDPSAWPAELRNYMDSTEVDTSEIVAQFRQREDERQARVDAGEFVEATYELTCARCDEKLVSTHPELLRLEAPFEVTTADASEFVERWGRGPDDGWNHRLFGIADPYDEFNEALVAFLRTHGAHKPQMRLVA